MKYKIFHRYMPTCYKCDKQFASKPMLQYHQQHAVCCKDQFPALPSFECRFCHKKLTSRQRLQYHEDKQVCQKQDKRCKFCNKTFSSQRNFRQHQCKIKHKEIEKFKEYNPQITISTIELLFDEFRQFAKDMPHFDIEEPWYNQQHWNSRCEECGCIRKERGHCVAHKKSAFI